MNIIYSYSKLLISFNGSLHRKYFILKELFPAIRYYSSRHRIFHRLLWGSRFYQGYDHNLSLKGKTLILLLTIDY